MRDIHRADIVITNPRGAGMVERLFQATEVEIRSGRKWGHMVAYWNGERGYYALMHPVTERTVLGASAEIVHGVVTGRYTAIDDPGAIKEMARKCQTLADGGVVEGLEEDLDQSWRAAVVGQTEQIGVAAGISNDREADLLVLDWSLNALEEGQK